MRKLILLLPFLLMGMTASALTKFYCGANNYFFHIRWFYTASGELGFEVEPIGRCVDGPWSVQGLAVRSHQEAETGGYSQAGAAVYRTLANFDQDVTPSDELRLDMAEAVNYINANGPTTYVNPHLIDAKWARHLAVKEGKSIYALTLKDHPFNRVLRFELWSIREQEIGVRLKDLQTGSDAHATRLSVREGANRNESVVLPGNLKGDFLMLLESPENTISRVVRLQ